MADILITGGTIITMDPNRSVIADGAVAIEADRIIAVGSREEIVARHRATKVIDAQRKVVLPGLIDTHGHAGHGLVKNLGGGYSDIWARSADKIYAEFTTEEFWYAESMLTNLERLKFGVTCGLTFFGGGTMVMRSDDPGFGDRHCEALSEVGIREFLVLGASNPPYPRNYTVWTNAGPTSRAVSFEDQLATTAIPRASEGSAAFRIGRRGSNRILGLSLAAVPGVDGIVPGQKKQRRDPASSEGCGWPRPE